MSLLICTKSPTTNCDEEPAPGEIVLDPDAGLGNAAVGEMAEGVERERTLSEVSDGPVVTFVKIAGLNVHLKDKRGTVHEVSFGATFNKLCFPLHKDWRHSQSIRFNGSLLSCILLKSDG